MILCCGEALIDMIPKPTSSGETGFVPYSGGAIFNTAIALGRLDVPTGIMSGISTDRFGQQLADDLANSNVDTRYAIRSERPTTLAFVQLKDGHAEYSFFDENSAGRMISPSDLPQVPDVVTALFAGGISLACEPGAETYLQFLQKESGNRLVMMDPNIRPGFIENADRYRTRLKSVLALTDIVKISDEDLDWLIPDGTSLAEKIQTIHNSGPSLVVLTKGRDGAVAYPGDNREIAVPAKRVDVVDTVGAGDTFNAGILAKLHSMQMLGKSAITSLSDEAIASVLEHAAKVASVTVSRSGANPPWQHEMTALA